MSLSQLLIWTAVQTGESLIQMCTKRARQQHVNNRFIALKKVQGQRHNYKSGCVIICCIFNVALFAVHFSLPTKSRYFHALSSVHFFILMSGFQGVLLLFCPKTLICGSWWFKNYTTTCFFFSSDIVPSSVAFTTASYRSLHPHPPAKSPSAASGYHTEGSSSLTWVNIETHHKHHYFLLACPSSSSVQVQVFSCVQTSCRESAGWPSLIKSDWLRGCWLLERGSSWALWLQESGQSLRHQSAEGTACQMVQICTSRRVLRSHDSMSKWLEYWIQPLQRHWKGISQKLQ